MIRVFVLVVDIGSRLNFYSASSAGCRLVLDWMAVGEMRAFCYCVQLKEIRMNEVKIFVIFYIFVFIDIGNCFLGY